MAPTSPHTGLQEEDVHNLIKWFTVITKLFSSLLLICSAITSLIIRCRLPAGEYAAMGMNHPRLQKPRKIAIASMYTLAVTGVISIAFRLYSPTPQKPDSESSSNFNLMNDWLLVYYGIVTWYRDPLGALQKRFMRFLAYGSTPLAVERTHPEVSSLGRDSGLKVEDNLKDVSKDPGTIENTETHNIDPKESQSSDGGPKS
ncbi:hypothetical protein BDQ12DRAFT_686481 [Crucibulum laeve]|uniref:Uncharacterized protein n=1 Tax=Crucibulum laeve TaxID=68775 RepID=A0A5C3LX64_9AGAR|nr:hypothetical protein BDQ12DRAFT_686481 [Crucibulum laeve]